MTRPLRYLMIATHVPASGAGGGMVRYTVEMTCALAIRDDVELHVLVDPAAVGFFRELVPPHRVHTVRSMPIPIRSMVERFGRPTPRIDGGFDVVHGPKHLLPRDVGGARRLLTVHDMLPFDRPRDFALLKRYLLRFPYLGSIRDADVIVTVSAASRARLTDYVPAAATRTTVVPLAVSQRINSAVSHPVDSLAGRRFALVVGDASARKNLALAVETWPEVLSAAPDAVLAVVGPKAWAGENRGRLWDEMVAVGSVVGLGHLPDEQLSWCYRNASVVLCPSMLEGYGLPSVEAVALGAPVLTTEDPAMCEASGEHASHVAAWNREEWVRHTADALTTGRDPDVVVPDARTWTEVAAETLDAVRGVPAPDAAPPVTSLADRIGVHPYSAPLRALHVVGRDTPFAPDVVERIAAEHRAGGWHVDVTRDRVVPHGYDVVVLHGLDAARLRRTVRGCVPTVVMAGTAGPGGPIGLIRQTRLARWTNALVVDSRAAALWAPIVVPVTSLIGFDPDAPVDAEAVAAILVRARAWGHVAQQATSLADGAAGPQPVAL